MRKLSLSCWLIVCISLLSQTPLAQTPSFEVASVRRSESKRTSIETSPGNLTMRGVTVQSCVRWAYSLAATTLKEYQVSGGPDWGRSEMYDIIAKPSFPTTENDQYRLMLQGLLVERFQLAIHTENKDLPVYVLSIGKNGPKVTASKDSGNQRKILPAAGGITVQHASMSDLADFLTGLPSVGRPVVDRTGLDGRFDFNLMLLDQQPEGIEGLKRAIVNSDFSNYAYAVEQLGLKLESQRAPVEFLVIDNVQKPSEN